MTQDSPASEQTIRASGRRMTMQRVKILEALKRRPGHSTTEQIYAQVCADDASAEMALSTVYRTLDTLTEMGLAVSFSDGGVTTYEWAGDDESHHHLVCNGCGTTPEIAISALADLVETIEQQHGFAVDLRHMAIRGQCAGCREKSEAPR